MAIDVISRVMTSVGLTLYLFILCLVLALLEIEIEGAHGWATGLPTWRFDPPWLLRLTAGKAVTGYHLWLNLLLGLWLHLVFFVTAWSASGELVVVGTYFFMAVQWDFLWFVLNPHFGTAKFAKENVPWHRAWLLGLPVDYYLGLAFALVLWLLGAALDGTPLAARVWSWLQCLLLLLFLTACVILGVRCLGSGGAGRRKDL